MSIGSELQATLDASRKSWIGTANDPGCDFPIQNLPFGVFSDRRNSHAPRAGVAIGNLIVDLAALERAGLLTAALPGTHRAPNDDASVFARASLNAFIALGRDTWRSVRVQLSADSMPVFIDKVQIQQVVFNLIRNSVEALPASTVRILSVSTARGDDGLAHVAVSDTGPGLAQTVLDQLFQPFVTTKEKGMGLGLSICRSIVEAHGGRLWATPNTPSGVTFEFSLPMAAHDEPEE